MFSNPFPITPGLLITVAVILVAFTIFAVQRGIRAHRLHVAAGKEDLVGKTAEVISALDSKGTVFVEGESWAAISEKGLLEPGEEVTITKVDGLKLYVIKKG